MTDIHTHGVGYPPFWGKIHEKSSQPFGGPNKHHPKISQIGAYPILWTQLGRVCSRSYHVYHNIPECCTRISSSLGSKKPRISILWEPLPTIKWWTPSCWQNLPCSLAMLRFRPVSWQLSRGQREARGLRSYDEKQLIENDRGRILRRHAKNLSGGRVKDTVLTHFFFAGNPVPKLIDATPDLSCPRQRFKRRCQTRIQDIDGFVHKICQSKTSSFIRKFSAQ